MKLHIVSDLHLEFYGMASLPVSADGLVLAGDIGSPREFNLLVHVAAKYLRAGLPVLYVPGNHEFYGHNLAEALLRLRRLCTSAGVTLLHNRLVTLGDVRIFGATGWTDYELSKAKIPLARQMSLAQGALQDHRLIRRGTGAEVRRFSTQDAREAHVKTRRLLDVRLREPFNGRTVIITHHGVHPKSVAARFMGDPINAAFVSDLSQVIEAVKPALWVHGHVHDSFDYLVGSTRIVTNPRGYPLSRFHQPGEEMRFENAKFDPGLVVTV